MEEEFYILCPTRPAGSESLISHLISADMCRDRQKAQFHKCPNCVRSALWKAAHPGEETGEESSPVSAASG